MLIVYLCTLILKHGLEFSIKPVWPVSSLDTFSLSLSTNIQFLTCILIDGFSHKNTDRFPDWASLCVDPQNVSGSWGVNLAGLVWLGGEIPADLRTAQIRLMNFTISLYTFPNLGKTQKKKKTKIVLEQNGSPT
jgi:hypothetical protein